MRHAIDVLHSCGDISWRRRGREGGRQRQRQMDLEGEAHAEGGREIDALGSRAPGDLEGDLERSYMYRSR